ncbi:unnamed protein product [Adineta steineri]|uniref:protein-tyrosine-phosphatase n=1 Tax=Adineta steineri TaxID=433720 RepID=A0A818MG60_9BILA|nr:unnamed protein product [Adineta steineri]
MWTKEHMNDDNIQMIIFLIVFFFSINITNGINDTRTNITLFNNSLPIENLLNQQYDNRHMLSNRTSSIRPWKKSNSIEILKKMIANRQRSLINNRTLTSTSITTLISTEPTTTTIATTMTTATTYLSSISTPAIRLKSKNDTTHSPIIKSFPEETSANTNYIPITTESNLFLYSSSTLKTNTSSNTTILIIILVCSFSGLLFVTLIVTFLLRRRISIAYFKLPCIHSSSSTKDSHDNTPLSHSPIHAETFYSANISLNGNNRNHRQRLYSISARRQYSLTNIKRQQHFNDNLSTASTNLSTVSLSTNSNCHSKFTVPEEFPVEQLYDMYTQKHTLDDLAFAIEFKSIPNFEELPCTAATRTIVASKNRFLNILPIDATRVVLNLLNDDPATDYINGNYISGYKCLNKFIATQGPKPDTCEDLWRMMWELKLKSIVMLTNVIEGASRMTKCHQYWPELGETITYGSYRITCFDIVSVGDYDKRYFQLIKINANEEIHLNSSSITPIDDAVSLSTLSSTNEDHQSRLIIQYHYTQWKDMDVPSDSHTLLHLIHEVNEQTTPEQYPIVVHCTAGVGRTGTYIAIDAMIDKIEHERKVDIYNFVLQMRRERSLMVQTVRQYVFIYRSLLEYYLYGNTRIEANIFRSTYSNLKKNKQYLLISEYNKLSLLPVENVSQRDAHSSDNIDKNRHPQIVPYDRNRVCLSRILGHPYINASFIEGYSRECSFIITQDPLAETIHEFWRMFIEHDSNCIVQLHTITDSSPKCPIYYPNDFDTTMKIGSTTLLKLVQKELIQEKIIIREFCLTDTREALSKTIYHFEYLLPISTNDEYENGQCIPTNLLSSLFDFIGYINKRQHTTNHDRYITVHCGNGGPSCSLFCMCVMLLDQLKNEHAVDIFQRVRALQRQRIAMIMSLAQYEYLYEMILKFLEESFDLAAGKSSPSLNNSVYDNNMIDQEDTHDRL